MFIAHGITYTRRLVVLATALALLAMPLLMAAHQGSDAHCGLEGPDHQCQLCRAVSGNPLMTVVVADFTVPSTFSFVAVTPAPSPLRADGPHARNRAPPVLDRVA